MTRAGTGLVHGLLLAALLWVAAGLFTWWGLSTGFTFPSWSKYVGYGLALFGVFLFVWTLARHKPENPRPGYLQIGPDGRDRL